MTPARPTHVLAASVLLAAALALPGPAGADDAGACRFFEGMAFRERAEPGDRLFFGGLTEACREAAQVLRDQAADADMRDAATALIADLGGVREMAVAVAAETFAATRRSNLAVWNRVQTLGVSHHTVYFIARDADLDDALDEWQMAKAAWTDRSKS